MSETGASDALRHKPNCGHARVAEKCRRSFVKALSYRCLGSLTSGIIGWVVTGSAGWGFTIGIVDWIIKPAVYFFHERLWLRVEWGLTSDTVEQGGGI